MTSEKASIQNEGTLVIDATCAPASIAYPRDLQLLNDARKQLEGMIDHLHDQVGGKKPRTYRKKARKQYLLISKSKRPTRKKLRQAIRQQLEHVKRNLQYIENYLNSGRILSDKQLGLLDVIKTLYRQQKEMYDQKKHTIKDRIVSLFQPHVRPIVRGKVKAPTEFGAKVEISIVNGYIQIETLSWDAYNESETLIPAIERYYQEHDVYPKRVLADKIYRNRKNLAFCKEHGIRLSGPALGRPKKNQPVDKKEEYQDLCERNIVEGKFGEGKNTYGLNRIITKKRETSEAVIYGIMMTMNLTRRLREE